MDAERRLTGPEHELIARAREKAFVFYEGKRVAHRSCGIALAETWGLPTSPYQSLRRGGITGEGECGAMKAGELILGELLGDPNPTGPVTPQLREAIVWYQREMTRRFDRGGAPDVRCNTLTRRFGEFGSAERAAHCTSLAALVAEVLAEALVRVGAHFEIEPIVAETLQ